MKEVTEFCTFAAAQPFLILFLLPSGSLCAHLKSHVDADFLRFVFFVSGFAALGLPDQQEQKEPQEGQASSMSSLAGLQSDSFGLCPVFWRPGKQSPFAEVDRGPSYVDCLTPVFVFRRMPTGPGGSTFGLQSDGFSYVEPNMGLQSDVFGLATTATDAEIVGGFDALEGLDALASRS